MGQQIQTAFDEDDDRRIASWLSANFNLLWIPYPFDGPQFSPKELPAVSGRRLLVFPPAAVELLSAHVISTSTPHAFLIEPAVERGVGFEWERTEQLEPEVFVAGGGAGSRFYFRKNDASPFNQEVSRMVRRLFAYVKR